VAQPAGADEAAVVVFVGRSRDPSHANLHRNISVPTSREANAQEDALVLHGAVPTSSDGDVLCAASRAPLALLGGPMVVSLFAGTPDVSTTYWVPDAARGEHSLLEALVKRQQSAFVTDARGQMTSISAPDDFVLVSSRPDIELANNFSNHRNERVNLAMPQFKLCNVARAVMSVSSFGPGHVSVTAENLRAGLVGLANEEYYLTRYRDYSAFATSHFPDAKRDRLLAPKYVERYFAVRVGVSDGVFVPITESQFLRGWELIAQRNLQPDRIGKEPVLFLDPGQFKSLGGVSGEFAPPSPNTVLNAQMGAAGGGAHGDADHNLPPAPHPWDLTPGAMQVRWQRFVRRQYQQVGRIAIKGAVLFGGALVLRQLWFPGAALLPGLPSFFGRAPPPPPPAPAARRRQSDLARDVVSAPFVLASSLFQLASGAAE
jgi:hypothetical protein